MFIIKLSALVAFLEFVSSFSPLIRSTSTTCRLPRKYGKKYKFDFSRSFGSLPADVNSPSPSASRGEGELTSAGRLEF